MKSSKKAMAYIRKCRSLAESEALVIRNDVSP